jgi:hypothetical protein
MATQEEHVPPHVFEPCPILCTHCSKLPNQRGIPCRRGLYEPWCKTCGDTSVCYAERGPGGELVAKCKQTPAHAAVMTHICCDCDATHAKDQIIVPPNAVPYSRTEAGGGSTRCVRDGAGCSEHLFEAADCPHVLCSTCLMRSMEAMLSIQRGAPQPDQTALATRFVVDSDDIVVPPCPICHALGAGRKHSGCFSLQTVRGLPPEIFNSHKALANMAFHIRQQENDSDDEDGADELSGDDSSVRGPI